MKRLHEWLSHFHLEKMHFTNPLTQGISENTVNPCKGFLFLKQTSYPVVGLFGHRLDPKDVLVFGHIKVKGRSKRFPVHKGLQSCLLVNCGIGFGGLSLDNCAISISLLLLECIIPCYLLICGLCRAIQAKATHKCGKE